ncbi:hypothetical protein F4678DRAFT_372010 [Xylaria arbuscula]|nr:hypothetical protein F4678DRAFT_372010 [Xylaria arbuscula]
MTLHSKAEHEEPLRDNQRNVGEDTDNDTDEEMEEWLSVTYDRGSKKPMKEPLKASWDLPISDADVDKLKVGFRPQSMDDKWEILIEEPDEDGNISIHILRSWLQEDCYILHIIPKPNNNDGGSANIHSITWEGNKNGLQCGAEQAKKEAVILCRGHLRCEFETLPDYPSWTF